MMASKVALLEERKEERAWENWGRGEFAEEAMKQVLFSVPMILTSVAYYGIPLVSVMFAGHLGDLELAGATLASSWATVSGFTLMIGLNGAMETLCGQAYGAKMYRKMGIYLQASIIICLSACSMLAVVWWFTEPILILLRQDRAVAHAAAAYMRPLIPALFAYGQIQCLIRFLQTQSIVTPLVVCSVSSLLLHIPITFALVHPLGMGYTGAAVAAGVSQWISLLMLVSYAIFSKRFEETWQGFSTEAFAIILPTLRLAIPSAIMVCLEYWAFEIMVLLAGLTPNTVLSTSLIAMCANTETVAYNITYGFSAVISAHVANELGAGHVDKAKKAVKVTLKLSIILALTFVLLLVFGHNAWAHLFSNSPLVITEFVRMTPLLSASILLDSTQGILSGVSRGCGWQHLAAWTNLAAFYLIGMPIALTLCFVMNFYVKGLWAGLVCGLFFQASTLLIIVLRTDWTSINLSVENDNCVLT
ncbi:protein DETOXIFICATION 19-like isoform X2 [Wolffia australiana]